MLNKVLVFDLDDTLFDSSGYFNGVVDESKLKTIEPFPGVFDFLGSFPALKILLTMGDEAWQTRKIKALGLVNMFEQILICTTNEDKKDCLERIKSKYPGEIWVIGDKVTAEIRYGNELGLKTVRMKSGAYKDLEPNDNFEIADYEILEFKDLRGVLEFKQ